MPISSVPARMSDEDSCGGVGLESADPRGVQNKDGYIHCFSMGCHSSKGIRLVKLDLGSFAFIQVNYSQQNIVFQG